MLTAVLEALLARRDLSEAEAAELGAALTGGDLPPALAGAMLAALRAKGETTGEVRGLARALRARAIAVDVPRGGRPLVDTAGTGGDGSHSLNLSTAAALLAGAAGCRVVKHGNRAVSSKSGSADVLEACGIALATTPDEAHRQLAAADFTFLFAPAFHPALKALAPVRRALGVRTVFNLLGPLLNPARPDAQVIGVATEAAGRLLARSAAGLTVPRVFVVHGADGWDEPTPVGPFTLWSVIEGRVHREVRDPADLGLARCRPEDLAGREPAHNAERLQAVLTGREHGAHRDAVLLGAALTLEVAGVTSDPRDALDRCRRAIDDGAAAALLGRLQSPARAPAAPRAAAKPAAALAAFVRDSEARARALPPAEALAARIAGLAPAKPLRAGPFSPFGLIAEVKFKAPSQDGLLGDASPAEAVRRARAYERGGAAAISVLTCPEGFAGHLEHLEAVAASAGVPVMRKDFLVSPAQVFEARLAGASGVLLIARILDDLPAMLQAAAEAGVFALVELFDEADLDRLGPLPTDGTVLVGVNARCLDTLRVVPTRHADLRARLPGGLPTVAESGLEGPDDAARVAAAGYDLALVGSALMKDGRPEAAVGAMTAAGRAARGRRPCT